MTSLFNLRSFRLLACGSAKASTHGEQDKPEYEWEDTSFDG